MDNFLLAGTSKINITPQVPSDLAGMGRENIAKDIESNLYMRAFSFKKEDKTITIVCCDVLGIDDEIKEEISKSIGPSNELFICCSHTHWAPALRSNWNYQVNALYRKFFIESAVKVVNQSIEDIEETKLFCGKTHCSLNQNRRAIVDGTAFMIPVYPELAHLSNGPVDREVSVLIVKNKHEKIKGLLFNYGCHPISFPVNYDKISADYPGQACSLLEEKYSCISGFINGASGDIAPIGSLRGKFTRNALGETLFKRIAELVDDKKYEANNTDIFKSETFTIPVKYREEVLRRTNWHPAKFENTDYMQFAAGYYLIGQWAGYAFSGELFAKPTLEIKQRSKSKFAHACSYTNGYGGGYLPPSDSYCQGGYEVSVALGAEGSTEIILNELLKKSDSDK